MDRYLTQSTNTSTPHQTPRSFLAKPKDSSPVRPIERKISQATTVNNYTPEFLADYLLKFSNSLSVSPASCSSSLFHFFFKSANIWLRRTYFNRWIYRTVHHLKCILNNRLLPIVELWYPRAAFILQLEKSGFFVTCSGYLIGLMWHSVLTDDTLELLTFWLGLATGKDITAHNFEQAESGILVTEREPEGDNFHSYRGTLIFFKLFTSNFSKTNQLTIPKNLSTT